MKKLYVFILFSLTLGFGAECQEIKDSLQPKPIPKFFQVFTGSKWLVSPYLFYMPETNWVLGAGVKRFFNAGGEGDSTTRVSNTAVFAQYSLNNQLVFEHNYQIFTKHEKYYLMGYWGFSRFPLLYYGTGKNTQASNEELINFDLWRFENLTYRRLKPNFFAGIGFRYFDMFNLQGSPNGIMEATKVLGYKGSRVAGVNLSFLYDSRDNVLTPSQGRYLQAIYSFHGKTTGSQYQFSRYVLDARTFWKPFPKRQDVIGLQAYGYFTDGDVPFNELGQLGDDMIMRGYYRGFYRDKNYFALQAEYRLQLLKRWGIVGFAGVGDVVKSLSDISVGNLMPSYGGGIRFKINRKENVNLRVDYGFGRGQSNVYFFIAEAF